MLDSAFVQVVVGMILIYFVFSVFCSVGVELLSTWEFTNRWVKSRSEMLRDALGHMLGVPVREALYRHPLISSQVYLPLPKMASEKRPSWPVRLVSAYRRKPSNPATREKSARVSYISPANFAQALSEVLVDRLTTRRPEAELKSGGRSANPLVEEADTILVNLQNATGYMGSFRSDQLRRNAELLGTKARKKTEASEDQEKTGKQTQDREKERDKLLEIGRVTNALVRRNLLLNQEPLGGVEKWYQDCMDRVSGWYRRQAGGLTLGTAMAISVIMNVDTLRMVNQLWSDADVRAILVASARSTAADTALRPNSLFARDEGEGLSQAKALMAELDSLPLPVGWAGEAKYRKLLLRFDLPFLPDGAASCVLLLMAYCMVKLAGWGLSAMACSVGAPFWFDLMNRIARLRISGNKPVTAGQKA